MQELDKLRYLKDKCRWSATGDNEVMIARYHLKKMEWGEAVQYLERAIRKGTLSNRDKTYQLLADTYDCLGLENLALETRLKLTS